ncbi:MAG TPA: efflux RND transporter periplasmic adaptor subunit [Thermoanaerobaculia bacterium]|nr:efflux RND transporter periplasmic adaptor subunit [Thermoanaerobaculia bacterium]
MRRWTIRIGVVVALVAIVFALRRTVLKPEPLEVRAIAAARGQVEESVTNSRAGTIKAERRAQISPEVGGRAVDIPHREGERVAKGDVLLRLDPNVLEGRVTLSRRELQAAAAQRDQACTNAERSRRELARLSRLAKEGIISTDVLDQVQTAVETTKSACQAAQAGVAQAQASIDLQGRQLGLTVIRAPFSGIIADLSIEVGEYTTPSPPGMPIPPVIDLIDPESVYVSAPMDEVDSARIQPGQPVRISVDSYPGRTFPGTVRRIAPYVLDREEQNRTVEIEAGFDGLPAGMRLLPGTSADVEVILETRENVLRVPTPALLEGNRVLIVENGVLVEKKLTIGLKNWDWTEVRAGLAPGDQVVTSLDRPEVKAGAEVRIGQVASP